MAGERLRPRKIEAEAEAAILAARHGLLSACCPVSQRFLVQAARVDGADAEVHLGCAGARKAALLIQADGRDVAHTNHTKEAPVLY